MARFRFGDHIGSGGFGTVEHAERIDDDGNVLEANLAQKKLLPEWASDEDAVARFQREVRLLSEMDHPNVVPVRGRNLSADPPWFITPYADSTLAKELEDGKHEDIEWVKTTFAAVLAGMAYAHTDRRILHRDLKPENVLIVNGVPQISDFGLGKRLDPGTTHLTLTNIGMGTMAYMAPEQFRDFAHVGPAADVYALGKMLGEMLTGNPPNPGPPRLDEFPAEFRDFIDRCTQDAPGARYANAEDALATFQLLIAGGGPTADVSGLELDELLKRWRELPPDQDQDVVEAIRNNLVKRSDDEELYFRAVPRLPKDLVSQLIQRHPNGWATILESYNNHIRGSLPFEYCDVVANFYQHVFNETADLSQKRIVLDRLIELGPSHNRWHVGDVVAGLLTELGSEPAIAKMAAEVITENAYHARWFRDYVANRSLPSVIRAAFNSLDPRADEIPF